MSTQTSFFSTVSSFATPFVKSGKSASKDPLVIAKAKFATVANEQLKLIQAAAAKGFWFKKHGDGFVITLKNGAASLNLAQQSFAVGSAADAVKFIEQAKAAAQAGEFDELFKATARKVKAKVEPAAVVPAASATPEPVAAEPAAPDVPTAPASKGKKK